MRSKIKTSTEQSVDGVVKIALVNFELSELHRHGGKNFSAGDVLLLREDQAAWLSAIQKGRITDEMSINELEG